MTTLSLELAKELQEVCESKGITMPESEFNWKQDSKRKSYVTNWDNLLKDLVIAPAYTLDELLEWLPGRIEIRNNTYINDFYKQDWDKDVPVMYNALYATISDVVLMDFTDPNPCDACGKLLIWLIKENLL